VQNVVLEGIAAIHDLFTIEDMHPPSHQSTNVVVRPLAKDSASASSKWMVVSPESGQVRTGEYHDVLTRTAHGWRISERRVVALWWPS
jgi:hypothetical protein